MPPCVASRLRGAVIDAKKALMAAEQDFQAATALDQMLNTNGLYKLPPCKQVFVRKGMYEIYWQLLATQERGVANGCGELKLVQSAKGARTWSWYSTKLMVPRYVDKPEPCYSITPSFVEDVGPFYVTSDTPPEEFVEFALKHTELMYDPETQRKRNKPGVLVRFTR